MFKLVIQDDEGKTTVVPLIRDEITIGRKEGNTIRLTERNVSRRHARILRNNGEVQIEDLGSYNGIRVNNARIAERVSLRVSDQVQIGDYKLYLKAEGVEQVDDARTMPIERVEPPPTDMMAAVTPAATAQIPVTPAPTAAPVAAAARAALADTDPAARPVATAAQIAALSSSPTHGKLVVVSSNLAGKEYELTRAHMVIGRTDDNDIIINHRSISRNNVRITRDPQSGRYTITDVNSSNGVRVNGQEYKNVELRRGDLVDLGHVRLRFVEAGEDFIFSRDAVIADIVDTGSKRGLLVAVILGAVVLCVVGGYIALRGGGGDDKTVHGSGDNGVVEKPDAATATAQADDAKEECLKLRAKGDWQHLLDCANKLPAGPDAEEFKRKSQLEQKAELANDRMLAALKNLDLITASKELETISEESTYRPKAKSAYDQSLKREIDKANKRANAYAAKHQCPELKKYVEALADGTVREVSDAVRGVRCTEPVAVNPDRPKKDPNEGKNPGTGSGSAGTVTPPCDAVVLADQGKAQLNGGQYAAAIASFEKSMKCKGDPGLTTLMYMAACKGKLGKQAAAYFGRLAPTLQPRLSQICLTNGIDPKTGGPPPP
jgi:pSer/pThr/pTyr-binding forkhead associated (FHA) protein